MHYAIFIITIYTLILLGYILYAYIIFVDIYSFCF